MGIVRTDKQISISSRINKRLDKRLIDIILAEKDVVHKHAAVEEFRVDLDIFMGKSRGVYYPAMGIDELCLKRKFDYYTAEHHILFHSKHNLVHFYLKFSSSLFACIDESREGKNYIFTVYSHNFRGVNGSMIVATELRYQEQCGYADKPKVYANIIKEQLPSFSKEQDY
ncbi:hypothetical protein HZA96_06770 [Candidatus Woesearchaeota archaeon]|nr:hypothetical protein [Candidatus Woesearchaeota archaeon]